MGAPLTTSAIGNRYMYTGREWDAESEIYYYRARMYDPVLGRFLQRDPVGYQDSLNLYQYAGNSPTNAFDPMGGRIKWNWGGAWAAIRNNATAAIGTVIVMAIGHYCLPAAAMSALSGSLAVKILSLAASAGLAWEAQEVLNRFCSKKLYDDPLTTEMIVNVFIGLGSIGLSLLKAAKAGKAPIWSESQSETSVENAFKHFKKHGNEFPEIQNSKQYVEEAKEFLNNPPKGTFTKIRSNGDILRYDPNSNTFGVQRADGAPKTMFKPKGGIEYWNTQ